MSCLPFIASVASLWPESTPGIQPDAAVAAPADSLPIVAAAMTLVTLAFFRHILYAVSGSALLLFTPGTHSDLNEGVSFKRAAVITAIICIPLVSICLVLTGISRLSILWTTVVTASYLALQAIFSRLVRVFSDKYGKKPGSGTARSIFILFTILCVPAAILSFAFPESCKSASCIYICIIASASALYYLASSLVLIPKLGFSYFFTFLYLCSVQLLPLAATVKILL